MNEHNLLVLLLQVYDDFLEMMMRATKKRTDTGRDGTRDDRLKEPKNQEGKKCIFYPVLMNTYHSIKALLINFTRRRLS